LMAAVSWAAMPWIKMTALCSTEVFAATCVMRA
jgi:hypothetical protein